MNGSDIGTVKLLLLLYADDIVFFGKMSDELQKSLDILETYCDRWKLTVNTTEALEGYLGIQGYSTFI